MEFQLSYFKYWKMMLWKCCTQYASKFGKLSSGHRTGKVSFHSNPKEVQFSSVVQSCLTLRGPMNRNTPGLPVHHQLLEITQTQVHQVSDAIQPSHPLLSPSPPAPNHIECSTLTASSFRIWNSSTGIPSPPLALFVVMLSKAYLTSHSRMSGSRW